MRIALLEDDADQVELMTAWLNVAGHILRNFPSIQTFQKGVALDTYDLFIIDWQLPDGVGLDALKWLREQANRSEPVLFVTRVDSEDAVVTALAAGADDYMTKPVRQRELLARLDALFRRHGGANADAAGDFPPFHVDRAIRRLTRDGEVLDLTEREFDLAAFLFENHGRVLSRAHLLEAVWRRSADVNTRTVDVHLSRLRRKLGLSGEYGWRLSSIYQHGYRLTSLRDADPAAA